MKDKVYFYKEDWQKQNKFKLVCIKCEELPLKFSERIVEERDKVIKIEEL